ncbi:MAG: DUF533 domain-containing protein [Desulfuromusa sp.]|nr:DUF533 domain-containing protein [Desulfuromusa sp.]
MSMSNMLCKLILAGLVAKSVSMAGGKSRSAGGAGLAGALGGNKSGSAGGGGIEEALGGLLGGNQGGGLGALLNGLGGGGTSQQSGGIGDILGSFMSDPQQAGQLHPTADQEQQAEVLLRAMLNAAKSDGQIDKAEQERIVENLGDISESEKQFLRDEMSAPLDADAFVRSIPKGMVLQVYLMSLTSIDLDSKAEAQYLNKLAQGLGISPRACNHIHQQAGCACDLQLARISHR